MWGKDTINGNVYENHVTLCDGNKILRYFEWHFGVFSIKVLNTMTFSAAEPLKFMVYKCE